MVSKYESCSDNTLDSSCQSDASSSYVKMLQEIYGPPSASSPRASSEGLPDYFEFNDPLSDLPITSSSHQNEYDSSGQALTLDSLIQMLYAGRSADNPSAEDSSSSLSNVEQSFAAPAVVEASPSPEPAAANNPVAASVFMTQIQHPLYNPTGSTGNVDCGPTSLAMAFRALGVRPGGLPGDALPAQWIDATRIAMTGRLNHSEITGYVEMQAAASKLNVSSRIVPGIEGIEESLARGRIIIADGGPYNNSYADRLGSDDYWHFGSGIGHFIMVAGRSGSDFIVYDPLSKRGPILVSRTELANFIQFDTVPNDGNPANPNGLELST